MRQATEQEAYIYLRDYFYAWCLGELTPQIEKDLDKLNLQWKEHVMKEEHVERDFGKSLAPSQMKTIVNISETHRESFKNYILSHGVQLY